MIRNFFNIAARLSVCGFVYVAASSAEAYHGDSPGTYQFNALNSSSNKPFPSAQHTSQKMKPKSGMLAVLHTVKGFHNDKSHGGSIVVHDSKLKRAKILARPFRHAIIKKLKHIHAHSSYGGKVVGGYEIPCKKGGESSGYGEPGTDETGDIVDAGGGTDNTDVGDSGDGGADIGDLGDAGAEDGNADGDAATDGTVDGNAGDVETDSADDGSAAAADESGAAADGATEESTVDTTEQPTDATSGLPLFQAKKTLNKSAAADLKLVDVRLVDAGDAKRKLGPRFRLVLRNSGSQPAGKFRAQLIASRDGTANAIAPKATAEVAGVAAGQTKSIEIRMPDSDKLKVMPALIVSLDSANQVKEVNKKNNVAVLNRAKIRAAN